jgi:putative transposase
MPNGVATTSAVVQPARGHRALRCYRVSLEGHDYFVTACAARRERLFGSDDAAAVVFRGLYALEVDHNVIDLIASVVMPDHVHAVFTLRRGTLDQLMKRFRGGTAHELNRLLVRSGTVWQRGYFERLLRPDDDLSNVLSYMWHNPMPPGVRFRCRRDVWVWFRTMVSDRPEYHDWLKLNP